MVAPWYLIYNFFTIILLSGLDKIVILKFVQFNNLSLLCRVELNYHIINQIVSFNSEILDQV